MFKKSFKKFDFRGFVDFIYELVDKYGMYEVRFYPEHRELFSEFQLAHIAPSRSINNQNGFAWAWKQKRNEVKKVSFDLFAKAGSPKITMSIDLDKKFISLDKIDGLSVVQIEEVIENTLIISDGWFGKLPSLIKRYLIQITVGIIITVIGGVILRLVLQSYSY